MFARWQGVGLLRVRLTRAAGLKAADINLLSKNSSDPYVLVQSGGQEKKTKVSVQPC